MINVHKDLDSAISFLEENWKSSIEKYASLLSAAVKNMKKKEFEAHLVAKAEQSLEAIGKGNFAYRSFFSRNAQDLYASAHSYIDQEMHTFLENISQEEFAERQKAIEKFHSAGTDDKRKGYIYLIANLKVDFNYHASMACLEALAGFTGDKVRASNDNNSNTNIEDITWLFFTSVRVSEKLRAAFDTAVNDAQKLNATPVNRLLIKLNKITKEELHLA